MTANTVGREVVQIVEIVQPFCANTFGSAPCQATGTADEKCYNTRATCKDTANFRSTPEALLTPDYVLEQGDIGDPNPLDGGSDVFIALDVRFGASPSGVIFEAGGTGTGLYIGVAGGQLIARCGDGSGINAGTARIATDIAPYLNRAFTLLVGVDVSSYTISAWSYVAPDRKLELIGTDAAVSAFPSGLWSGTDAYGVGVMSGTITLGEASGYDQAFSDQILAARIYDATSAPDMNASFGLALRFSRGNVADRGVEGAPYIIASLVSVSTAPTRINIAASDRNAQGLGQRALCTITFQDHPHTDRVVDPYVEGRSWNPEDPNRGSFWARWLVRNQYRQNMQIKVYEGYAGQALSEMTMRRYFLSEVSQVSADGRITIRGKDILARVEERKAQAPTASPGLLFADINSTATSFLVANAVVDDYPPSGTIRVNDEIMTYSGVSVSGENIQFTGVTRGTDGTVADDHDADDAVQRCLRYTDMPVADLLELILTKWGGIDASWLDTANWQAEALEHLSFYNLSALITEPTSVNNLISEIQEQALCFLWWDERDSLVKLRAVRGLDSRPPLFTDRSNIIEGSVRFTEKPRERASQVWVYYNQFDYTEKVSEPKAYKSQFVIADLESEGPDLYGEPSIRKVYGRWLPTDALAQTTASKIKTRYADVPAEIEFTVDAKDGSVWTGDFVEIEHFRDVDAFGKRRKRFWMITSAEAIVPGEQVQYRAQDTSLFGLISYIMPDGSPDYPGAESAPLRNCYIGDSSGLLSNGSPSGKIL